jgi:hypothetical protein
LRSARWPPSPSAALVDTRSAAVERALRRLETLVPYLRRHVTEHFQAPTPVHLQQVHASLQQLDEQLACIIKHLA